MTGVWWHTEAQMLEIKAQAAMLQEQLGVPVATVMAPVTPFYRAEEYHQKYLEKMGMGRSYY